MKSFELMYENRLANDSEGIRVALIDVQNKKSTTVVCF